MTQIHILLVEDRPEIREGFLFIINSFSGFVCKAVSSAEEAIAEVTKSTPDVILMDIQLKNMNGIECTRILKRQYPKVLIMMCTVFEDPENIFEALKAGASGYILKRSSSETLIDAIKELLNGGAPMSSAIARKVVAYFQNPIKNVVTEAQLTEKETQILDMLAKGHGNKHISDQLFISINTVKTHIRHIYEKLQVNNRVEALNKIKGK